MENKSKALKKNYRNEIDGLRAFAVAIVIINHLNENILPSGYLGVDIFFVISGYVITLSLNNRTSNNFIEFYIDFFERRIKRLIPALIPFTLFTGLLICFFDENPLISIRTGITSLFGFSNVYLLSNATNYFGLASKLNAFTHTWSLDVEEQFYVVFPLIIWFTGFGGKKINGHRNLLFTIITTIVFSLVGYLFIYRLNQSAAYFLMPTRFWEMAFGCLTFLLISKNNIISKKLKTINSNITLLGIILVLFIPIEYSMYATILIVLLTALLISNLNSGTFSFDFFSNKKIVHIGKISYSLYLYHWTVIVISRHTIGIHLWTIPFQLLIMYSLAYYSYKFIENPFRDINWSFRKIITLFKSFLLIVLTGGALFLFENKFKNNLYLGNRTKSLSEKTYFESFFKSREWPYKYCSIGPGEDLTEIKNIENIFEKCFVKQTTASKTLFFVGDSHSNTLWIGQEYIANKKNSNFFTFTSAGNLFPSVDYFRVNSNNRDFRKKSHQIIGDLEGAIIKKSQKGDIVFINQRYPYYFNDNWYEYPVSKFRYFNAKGQVEKRISKEKFFNEWLIKLEEFSKELDKKEVKVVLSLPTPEFPNARYKFCQSQKVQWFNNINNKNKCSYPYKYFASRDGKYYKIIKALRNIDKKNKNFYLFDSLKTMCPDAKCNYSDKNKLLYKNDPDHLSNFSARNIIAPKLIEFLNMELEL